MTISFDPLTLCGIILVQLANRYMKFDLTEKQEKLIMHPWTQLAMYTSVVYFTTRNIPITLIVIIISYTFIYILFNEKHRLNVLSISWLNKDKPEYISPKEAYKENINKYHSVF
jgi:hypothetical protein